MDDFEKLTPQHDQHPQVDGWASDADRDNEPTYPMRTRTGEEHEGYSWERPEQQRSTAEVLHSNERPNLTAVYGATNPPSGLSGMLRRWAFRYGEGVYAHWILLIVADRVNMVEGVLDDLRHFRVPNIVKETGMKAEWQHNRKAVYKKAAITTALAVGTYWLITRKRR
jgi:hypothetical protein